MAHVRTSVSALVASIAIGWTPVFGATPGALDASFGTAGKVTTNFNPSVPVFGEGRAVAAQADGKYVVCGDSVEGGTSHYALLRYNANGTLDSSFGDNGLVRTLTLGGFSSCNALALQSDQKIVAAGFNDTNGNDFVIVRYTTAGELDASFGAGGVVTVHFGTGFDRAADVVVQSDGKIVVVGTAETVATGRDMGIVRLNSDGSPDTSFGCATPGTCIGRTTVAIGSGTVTDEARGVAIDSVGRIVLAGRSVPVTGAIAAIARLNANGTLDTTFASPTGFSTQRLDNNQTCTYLGGPSDQYSAVAILPGDKIIAAGSNNAGYHNDPFNGVRFALMAFFQYNADGSTDTSFGPGGDTSCVEVGGGNNFPRIANTTPGLVLVQVHDTTPFNGGSSSVRRVTVTGGKILALGGADMAAGGNVTDYAAVRLNASGTLDTTFGCAAGTGCSGKASIDLNQQLNGANPNLNDNAVGGLVDGSGRVVMTGFSNAGSSTTTPLVGTMRLTANGVIDTTFNTTGVILTQMFGGSQDHANALALMPDGKPLLAGSTYTGAHTDFAFARYTAAGAVDTTFGTNGILTINSTGTANDVVEALAVRSSDGEIFAAGNAGGDLAVIKLSSAGVHDTAFGTSGVARATFTGTGAQGKALAIQPDGKLVAAGNNFPGGPSESVLARFTAAGALDNTFGTGGKVTLKWGTGTNDSIYSLVLQPDGKVIVAGTTNVTSGGTFTKIALARFTTAGVLDTTFGCPAGTGCTGMVVTSVSSGTNEAYSVGLQPDGRIVVGGKSNTPSGTNDFMAARYLTTGVLDTSFGTGGFRIHAIDLAQNDQAWGLLARVDGRVVLFGSVFNAGQGNDDFAVAVLRRDGSLDTTFNASGTATANLGGQDFGNRIATAADGQFLLGGTDGRLLDFLLSRMFAPTHEPAYFRLVNDTGRFSTDNLTKDTLLNITGTCFRGDTVQLTVAGANFGSTQACAANDSFDITFSSPLAHGTHSIGGHATNPLTGQSTNTYVLSVEIDTVAPAAPDIHFPVAGGTMPSPGSIGGAAEPNASVEVFEGAVSVCTGIADGSGAWSCNASLSIGSHTIKAAATDVAGNTGAFSTSVTFTARYPTTTAVASNLNPSTFGQTVTLTATVTSTGGPPPTGTAQFMIDAVNFGSPVTVTPGAGFGTAAISTASLGAGPHNVAVHYNGDAVQETSNSAPLTQTVNQAPQTITFAQPAAFTLGNAPFAPPASSDSGLIPILTSTTTAVCTVASNVVTLVAGGICTLTASQPGNANYAAATPVIRSFAVRKQFTVTLEGTQEVPVNLATATGGGTAMVDPGANTITFSLTFSGLTGAATGANLYGPAVRGATAGVKFPVSSTSPINNVINYLEADEADILAGKWYVNVLTAAYPGGEIRGQLDDGGATAFRLLTVAKSGIGSGTVTGSATGFPGIINCGATCSYNAPQGMIITLTAAPNAGTTFTGWSGGGCSGTGTCVVTISAATTVTANFSGIALAVIRAGGGTGTITSDVAGISCGIDCSQDYASGATVVLTAVAGLNSTFTGWDNCPSVAANLCTVTMSATRVVTARFVETAGENVTTQVAGGNDHTCAVDAAGALRCWGSNANGRLGDGTTTDRPTPTAVSLLASGVVEVAPGGSHTCALTLSGGVKCWGANANGQLGDATNTERLTPVDVSGLTSGVAAIATGFAHTCALTTAGGVKCWGDNTFSQLSGFVGNQSSPFDVSGLTSGVVAISAGNAHNCALTTAGGVKCWGSNGSGQLGDGFTGFANVSPGNVVGLTSGVVAIASGNSHTCALTSTGAMKCWGLNVEGQIGDNTFSTNRTSPTDVFGLGSGVVQISARGLHSCALTASGGMKCWGRNTEGQVGDISTTNREAPTDVTGLTSGVTAIATGTLHTCAQTTARGTRLECWGSNLNGRLGDGTTTNRSKPVAVTGLGAGITAIGGGLVHTCAINLSGEAQCWGFNNEAQLGDGTTTARAAPVDVTGLSGLAAITGGYAHTCAITAAGGVKCWGDNLYGQVGDNTGIDKVAPVDVTGLASGVAAITTGVQHSCAITNAGGAKCWGDNAGGKLGDGTSQQRNAPVDVSGLTSGVAAISAGHSSTCVLTAFGGVKCFGSNGGGQLGDNTEVDKLLPTDVHTLPTGVIAIAAGGVHACALTSAGGVKCWGDNTSGQIGDGTNTKRLTPVDVLASVGPDVPLTGVVAIAAGAYHTCAITSAGAAKCWGANSGQLGVGNQAPRTLPTDVLGLASGVAAVTAASGHTCVLMTTGVVKCFGYNDFGQLGDNSTTQRLVPTDAVIGPQAIAFSLASPLAVGAVTPLSATSAGGAVAFDTWTPSTCSVSGGNVTASAAALCGVRASQAGTTGYFPAPRQLRLVRVLPVFTVTPGVTVNGALAPNTPQSVAQGATTSFTVTPNANYHIDAVAGCSGSLAGNTYTTGAITGACTVTATFAIDQHTVSVDPVTNGTITPSTAQSVNHGTNTSFTLAPAAGYHIGTVSGCGGSLVGNTYTTAALNANCTVTATFAINQWSVSVDPVTNGTIAPSTTQTVNHGSNTSFTLTPAANHHIGTVTGCGGSLAGNIYTTGAVTGTCTVTATFAIDQWSVSLDPVTNGTIAPSTTQTVNHGSNTSFTLTPAANHHIGTATGCGGSLVGNTYTTGAITGNCTVTATFAINQWSVSVDPVTNGTIAPGTAQAVNHGSNTSFTLTPAANYHIGTVTGCGGSLVGNTYTTGAITGNCTVTATFAINQYTVGLGPVTNGTIAPSAAQTVNHGSNTSFTLTPAANHHIGTVTGCGGLLVGNTYTTGAITGNCTVTATFAIDQYTVGVASAANGTIAPSTAQTVNHGSNTSFTLTPAANHHIGTVTGCGGSLAGNTYTTAAITGNCTVTATFALDTYTVTSSAGANGSISPLGGQSVGHGSQSTFTVTPSPSYTAVVGGTCGGNLVGNTYTTNAITANCTVSATFTQVSYTVTSFAGIGGTISPTAPRTIAHGATTTFTVTPDAGYTAVVGGTCGGTLVGNTYTTNPITANCLVGASFTPVTYTVTSSAGANGTISPLGAQTVGHGGTATFTVTPNAGYTAVVGGTCGGSLAGTTYTTSAITANCTVAATFTQVTYTVTSSAGANGTISPLGAQTVGHGGTATFTVTPSSGYHPTVAGTCGGALTGTTYTTSAISADCTVVAVFTLVNPPRLVNISTRGRVMTGDNVMIGGLIVGGPVNKTVVIRARGPSMVPLGVTNPLVNPKVDLYSGQTVIASSDDWGGNVNAPAITASGFAPPEAAEGAILINLAPGPYTAIVSGVGGTTGVGLVEVFEVDHPEVPLINIATRGRVQTGLEVMIAGFIIQGAGQQTVVVRARGPSLTAHGVPDVLANPTLALVRSSDGVIIASNDNWQTAANAADLTASGFAPENPLEAAILITLDPGAYTAIVRGAGETSGVAIVEVFRN